MIFIHGHHGVHIHFLNYCLEVMTNERNILTDVPGIFDATPDKKFFKSKINMNKIVGSNKIIWVRPENRLLFAYNLFTRSIQNITNDIFYKGTDENVELWIKQQTYEFEHFTIRDWEKYPIKYILGCGMISHQYDNLKQMSNDDGTIPPDKFTWWYLQEILTNNRYYAEAKFPGQDVLEVPNTMFYDIDLFEQWINIIKNYYGLDLKLDLLEDLYQQLQQTLTYDKKSVLSDGSILSKSFAMVGDKYQKLIYPQIY